MSRKLAIFLIVTLLLSVPAYAINPEDAREWLKGKNVPYTAKEFVRHAGQGDLQVVTLFLDAGMDPDAKDENGRTTMQAAIDHARGDVIMALLDKGASREPLISMIGDKDTLLRNSKSIGYLMFHGEYPPLYGKVAAMAMKDDFAEVLSPGAYRESKTAYKGSFGGLGIVIKLDENKTLQVVSVIENTPAAKAGIMAEDRIAKINSESTEGIVLEEAVKKLRGLKSSQANITVKRRRAQDDDAEEKLDFTLTRDEIKIPSVKWRMLDESIAYIHLTEFSEQTADEFREGLKELKLLRMRRLVLDLRSNPGGLLGVAADVADEVLDKDRLICAMHSIHDGLDAEFKAKREASVRLEAPIVVLQNGGTGGASEMLAAALRHWQIAVVLGEKTHGIGSVRNTIPLSDGSAITVTTARLLTPNRDLINRIGLAPDIIVKTGPRKIIQSTKTSDTTHIIRLDEPTSEVVDEQLDWAVKFLQSYDSSEKLERNIYLIKERIEDSSGKDEQERILWDKPVEKDIFQRPPYIK